MAGLPVTTLVPFASLPSCASNCGPLYDANGACVPPAVQDSTAESYERCFCNNNALSGLFSNPPTDVCNGACSADAGGYMSIRSWFTSFCQDKIVATSTTTATARAGSSGSGDNSWLSNHWRWVVMLIIISVAIISIWVGACIWRRRYLKKKERMYEMRRNQAARTSGTGPWAPGSGVNMQSGGGVLSSARTGGATVPHPQPAIRQLESTTSPAVKEMSETKGKGKERGTTK